MSSKEGDDEEVVIRTIGLKWLMRQPFPYVLTICVLGSIVYLGEIDKPALIPYVIQVGIIGVIVAMIILCAGWFAPKVAAILDAIPKIEAFGSRTTDNFEHLTTSFSVLSRFVSAVQAENTRNNKLVLLVEDSFSEARLIRAMCADVVGEFHLSFRDVGSLTDAFAYINQSCLAVIDVVLPDNDSPVQINVLIDLAGCPVIVHSNDKYTAADFPRAFAVLNKSDGIDKLKVEMRKAIASTRFPK